MLTLLRNHAGSKGHQQKAKIQPDRFYERKQIVLVVDLVSGCQTRQSTCAYSVVSARRDLVFAFVVLSF